MDKKKKDKDLDLESLDPKREKGCQKDEHPNQYGNKNENFGIGADDED